jgi:peptidoglycan/LPS O-acetylase OafA/YrhL
VLVSHTVHLSTSGPDSLGRFTGSYVDLSTIAVDGFFALSGFLIVGSFLRSPSVGRYLWRRALRILPGYWVCLLVTAGLIAPLAFFIEHGELDGFPVAGDASATSFVWQNVGLLIRQFEISGTFGGEVANGSLHTLFYEFVCYLLVAVVGAAGVLARRPWLMVVGLAMAWALILSEVVTDSGLVAGQPARETLVRYGTMFLAGAVMHLFGDRIPLTGRGGVLAAGVLGVAIVICSLIRDDARSMLTYALIAPPAVAYLVMLCGASPRLARVGSRRDLSYGLYVYAWPVQATLLVMGAADWWLPVYLAVSLVAALAMALLSWTFIESPALALKSWTPKTLLLWQSQRAAAQHAPPQPNEQHERDGESYVRSDADR